MACGPEPDPYDYYIQYFHSDLQKDKGFFPFYYNGATVLNGYSWKLENDNKSYEQNENAGEWAKYLGRGVSQKGVYKVLYLLDRPTDSIYFHGRNKTLNLLPDSLKSNTFIKAIKKNNAAMAYFLLAKQTEYLVTIDDLWDANKTWNKNDQHAAAMKYLTMAGRINDKFIKLRCYYQAQRLLHYGLFFREADSVYGKYIYKAKPGSAIKNWALGFKAGEEYRLGNNIYAARLYAREFMVCPERMIQAYYDFRDTKAPIDQLLKTTKSNAEKAIIYGISGFQQAQVGLGPLEKAYNIDPKSPVINVLLAREVNKLEEQYVTPRAKGGSYYESIGYWERAKVDSLQSNLAKFIPQLKAFCNRLAEEKKYPEPAFAYIASAYLSWMMNDPGQGLSTLDSIDKKRIRPKLYDEEQLVKLLLLSQNIKHLNNTTVQELLPSLQWLDKKVKEDRAKRYRKEDIWGEYDDSHYAASARDFYQTVLAEIYLRQKDTAMAALCILKSERTLLASERYIDDPGLGFDMPDFWQTQLHSWQLNKVLKWDSSSNKTTYMTLLLSSMHEHLKVKAWHIEKVPPGNWVIQSKVVSQASLSAVYELLGTAYLREHRYKEAVLALKIAGEKKLDHEAVVILDSSKQRPDLFDDGIREYPHRYNSLYNSKLVFALKMAELKAASQDHDKQKAARACYQMGNGFYNTSYYGNAWFYTSYGWASTDKTEKKRFYYDDDYMKERSAEKYFLKAAELSVNSELKARSIFMAAKCKQKQIPYPRDDYDGYLTGFTNDIGKATPATRNYLKAVTNNPYFMVLRDQYSHTSFYKTAVEGCSIFRDFLAGHNGLPAKRSVGR